MWKAFFIIIPIENECNTSKCPYFDYYSDLLKNMSEVISCIYILSN